MADIRAALVLCVLGCGTSGLSSPSGPGADSQAGSGGGDPPAACRIVDTRAIGRFGLHCSSRPSIAVDGTGAVHAAWVSTLPYSGHAALREPAGEWTAREGAYGQARTVSLAAAPRGVHALVDGLEGPTTLRLAAGGEVVLSGMTAAARRSVASGGDARLHVLLELLVEEPCVGTCSVAVLYRYGVARASGEADALMPERITLGRNGASALDVSARADGSAAFLFSTDGDLQLLDTDGSSRAIEFPMRAYASALALGADGSFHVLAQTDTSTLIVLSAAPDGDVRVSVNLERRSIASQCPTSPEPGDTCELDSTRFDSSTLVESPEAAYVVARASHGVGPWDYRCGLPADTPDGTYCDWRNDREPTVGLWIMRLAPDGPSEPVIVPAPNLPNPWMIDGTAVGRRLHLVVIDQPSPQAGCAATEVELDCDGL